ncbi:MAG: alkaline phosphatase [Candidatus Thorarchaeota archaeon]
MHAWTLVTAPRFDYQHVLTILAVCLLIATIPVYVLSYSGPSQSAQPNDLSIILMIGDGMGFDQVKLARWVEVGHDKNLTMENSRFNWSATTHSANDPITDSAAAGTAIATGVKTYNGRIAMDASGAPVETILEIAQSANKATGIVTTTTVDHATPASFMTHVISRTDYSEITRQIVEEAAVDVIMGGGNSSFSSDQLAAMIANGYSYVQNRLEFESITSGKVIGLFSDSGMDIEQTRNFTTTPSLAEMTNKSLEILSQDSDGFFLMVEGGQIDWGCHDNNKTYAALEAIAFDKAVNVSLEYVQDHSNTILIVTADHETGGLLVVSDILDDVLPSDSNTEEENRVLRVLRSKNVSVSWTTTSHTAAEVPVFLFGDAFAGLPQANRIDNTEIFTIMSNYLSTGEVSTTTTTTTTTTSTTTTDTTTVTTTSTTGETTKTTFPPPDTGPMFVVIGVVLISGIVFVLIVTVRRR